MKKKDGQSHTQTYISHTAEKEKREKAIRERKKREEMVKWMRHRQHKQDRENISERPPRVKERGQVHSSHD